MPVTPVGSYTDPYSTTTSATSSSVMGKDDFLQMLVTQLKYQDPLSPTTNEDFAAQLAMFSQLEELQNMNTSLDKSLESNMIMTQSINNSLATTLIGKDVKTTGTLFDHNTGDDDKQLSFTLHENAVKVKVNIYNEAGESVRSIETTNLEAGDGSVEWDGLTDVGSSAGDGVYSFSVEAEAETGEIVGVTPFQKLRITGVKYINGMANLLVGDKTIGLGEVLEILMPESITER